MRRRTVLGAAVVGVVALGLAACSGSSSPQPPTTVGPTVTADKSAPPTPEVEPVWPLTGVEGEPVQRPALAVKIENTGQARPQSGLEQADVVWETIVEFEVSRFVAVFHSQVPEEIGPVRSVRPVDPLIVSPLHGLLAYSGGQQGVLDLVAASGVQLFSHDAGADGLYRVSRRAAPHNVYGSPQTFWADADADHSASPPQQFAFAREADSATAVVSGTPAGTLSFRLSAASSPAWAWDAASGTWLRSEGTTPAMAASGSQLAAVNVVSITAAHPNTEYHAQGGNRVPTYELVGSGDAVIATGGKTVAVQWKKDAQDAPLQLFTADGAPATLAPGNTWVELVPAGSGSLTIG